MSSCSLIHALDAVFDDHGQLVGKRRIVRLAVRHRQRQHVALAVFVLQAFAVERGAAGGAAHHEALHPHVGAGPDQVADALEAEHRIEDEERDHVDAVRGVGRARGDERRHRAGFVDALFEDLAVGRFLVVEQRVAIDRLVELAAVRVDADLAEQRFHAEGARFVGDDRHDVLADLLVLQQLRQHLHEHHRRRRRAVAGALVELVERVAELGLDRLGAHRRASAPGRAAPCGAPGCTSSRRCLRPGGRTAPRATSSSEIGMPKRVRNALISSSLSFFCWWVMFLPSPDSPTP